MGVMMSDVVDGKDDDTKNTPISQSGFLINTALTPRQNMRYENYTERLGLDLPLKAHRSSYKRKFWLTRV